MRTGVGIFFYSTITKRYLYLLRSDSRNWSIPGGKLENEETLLQGLERECREEIAWWPNNAKIIPIQKFVNHTFVYHTFFCEVDCEFVPQLNEEHCGWAWVGDNHYPKPLHPGLFNTVNIDVVREKLIALTRK